MIVAGVRQPTSGSQTDFSPVAKTGATSYHQGMFGSHLSVAGGLHLALLQAQQLGMDCVQVFTKNQRQWTAAPLTPEQIDQWTQTRSETKIPCVVSHDSYLINLASPSDETHGKSMKAFGIELDRCDALDIPYLVTHPGAHMGQGEEIGLKKVADSLNTLLAARPELKVVTCLEITAGQGTSLGWKLEHLRSIIDQCTRPEKLGVCLDTAHLLAAGYDLTSRSGAEQVLADVQRIVGLDRVKVLHLNDSKPKRGSRVDRHEHIGLGHVSLDAFAVIVNHPKLRKLPMILETAKEVAPDGRPWDLVNIDKLKSLQT